MIGRVVRVARSGRALGSSTASPPVYTLAMLPQVNTPDALNETRSGIEARHAGLVIGVLAGIMELVRARQIWWMAASGLLGAVAPIIVRSCNDDIDHRVPAAEVERIEALHRARIAVLEPAP